MNNCVGKLNVWPCEDSKNLEKLGQVWRRDFSEHIAFRESLPKTLAMNILSLLYAPCLPKRPLAPIAFRCQHQDTRPTLPLH
jgi:hypothetical protein